jgi:hypothetical protein
MGEKSKPTFDWEMYRYTPSLAAAAVSVAIFSILGMIHAWTWLKSRNHIMVIIVLGILC